MSRDLGSQNQTHSQLLSSQASFRGVAVITSV